MTDKIKYLMHPVSPEEKAKLREQGYKILDARFAPEGEKVRTPAPAKKAPAKKAAAE